MVLGADEVIIAYVLCEYEVAADVVVVLSEWARGGFVAEGGVGGGV